MSINHYSSDHWWSHYVMDSSARTSSSNQKPTFVSNSTHFVPNSTATFWLSSDHHQAAGGGCGAMSCGKNSAFGFNLNNEDEEELQSTADDGENCNNSTSRELEQDQEEEITREPLFEKPLTPSDVGKLNRLVIPKQHAEKHFPLNNCGGGGGGGESGENGLLLSFEDEVGKSWRFRYSYWNSSQSYVLTKGWSRFVKEKRLDAGDIVVFLRHRVDAGRLFIGWRRRNSGGGQYSGGVAPPTAAVGPGGGGGWSRVYYSGRPYHQGPSALPYQLPDQCLNAGSSVSPNQTTAASGNSKRLRLFGVNLECQADDSEPSTPVGSPMSSQGQAHQHPYHQYYSNHMDIGFSGADVYRQG